MAITSFSLSYIQDETFIRKVREASDTDELLRALVLEYKEDPEVIKVAIDFIQLNLSGETKMSREDYQQILSSIQDYERQKHTRRVINFPVKWRIAATILMLIGIGSLIAFYQFYNDPITRFAQQNTGVAEQSFIQLSDGTEQPLKENNSVIDYQLIDGEIFVRSKDNQERIDLKNDLQDAALNQVVVPFGQRQKVRLCDGTLVHLNSGSKLTFPIAFSGETREVYLHGEGFFEVHKDADFPFIVKTNQIDVEVLGTSFNVSAYEDEEIASAVLVEGMVNVSENKKRFANKRHTLEPGQGYFFSSETQKSEIKEVDVTDFILWKEGVYKFKAQTLTEVVSRVRKYYNQSVDIKGDKLAKTAISGKLVLSDDINEVMSFLSKTMEANYEKSEDGTYILFQE